MATLYKNWTIDLIPGNTAAYQAVALVNGQPMSSPPTITDQASLMKWIDAYPTPAAVTQYIAPAQTFAPTLPTQSPYAPPQMPYYGPSPASVQAQQQAQAAMQQTARLQAQMRQMLAKKDAAPAPAPPVAKPLWQQPLVIGLVLAGVAGFFWFKSRAK